VAPDWADAYQSQIADAIAEYRRIRNEDPNRRVGVPGRRTMVRAGNLTDSQIDAVAWREAETDINFAMNQARAAETRSRTRASQAL
jgi:hypothetical protein